MKSGWLGGSALLLLIALMTMLRLRAAGMMPEATLSDRLFTITPSLAPELIILAACVCLVGLTRHARIPAGILLASVVVMDAFQAGALEVLGTYASLRHLHGVTFNELLGYATASVTAGRALLVATMALLGWWTPLAGMHRVGGRPLMPLATVVVAALSLVLLAFLPAGAAYAAPSGSPLLAVVAPDVPRWVPEGTPTPDPDDWAPAGSLAPQWASLAGVARDFNVVVVVLESTRASEFWPSPNAPPMPTMASLASSSVVFERAYSHDGRSIKGLEAILLGIYTPPRWEAIAWNESDVALDSMTARWSRLGARTAFLQAADISFDHQKELLTGRGVDLIQGQIELGREPRSGSDVVLVDALDRFVRQAPDRRFCAMLWPAGTHMPYRNGRREGHPLDSHDAYRDTLEELDRFLGELVRVLKEEGTWEQTVLVLVGDHGESFGEHPESGLGHGNWPFEESSHVPLILVNGRLFHGERDARIVQTKDVAATAAWLAGDERTTLNMGLSLFHQRRSEGAYFSNHFDGAAEAVVHGAFKYMQVYKGGKTQERLYDVLADPGERRDLSRERSSEVKALRDRLAGWHAVWSERWSSALSPLKRRNGVQVARTLFPADEPGSEVRWQDVQQLSRTGPPAKAYSGATAEGAPRR